MQALRRLSNNGSSDDKELYQKQIANSNHSSRSISSNFSLNEANGDEKSGLSTDDAVKNQVIEELQRTKEQSQTALEQSGLKIRELHHDDERISKQLENLEKALAQRKAARAKQERERERERELERESEKEITEGKGLDENMDELISEEGDSTAKRGSRLKRGLSVRLGMAQRARSMGQKAHSIRSLKINRGRSMRALSLGPRRLNLEKQKVAGQTFEEDEQHNTRVQLMRQETEEKVLEIKERTREEESKLQSLKNTMAEKQDKISNLQNQLDSMQKEEADVGDVDELTKQVQDLESSQIKYQQELNKLRDGLSEEHREFVELEDKWNDTKERTATDETDVEDKFDELQNELDFLLQDLDEKSHLRTQMMNNAHEALEALRQDLLDSMGFQTATKLAAELKDHMEDLQKKEQRLAKILVRRLDERRKLWAPQQMLSGLNDKASETLTSLFHLCENLDKKIQADGPADTPNDNNNGGDDDDDIGKDKGSGNDSKKSLYSEEAISEVEDLQDQLSALFIDIEEALAYQLSILEKNRNNETEEDSESNQNGPSPEDLQAKCQQMHSSIQASLQKIGEDLPDAASSAREQDQKSKTTSEKTVDEEEANYREQEEKIEGLRESVENLTKELHQIQTSINNARQITQLIAERSEKKCKKYRDEIDFLASGVQEKDTMIQQLKDAGRHRQKNVDRYTEEIRRHLKKGRIASKDLSSDDKKLISRSRSRSKSTSRPQKSETKEDEERRKKKEKSKSPERRSRSTSKSSIQ